MRVKRILFIDRAPFKHFDLSFEDTDVISLTGINGTGKTTILSYIVDAFYEMAKKAYKQEFSGEKEGEFYRISSDLHILPGSKYSMVYISFESTDLDIHYFDFQGMINEETFKELVSNVSDSDNNIISFDKIYNQVKNGGRFAKYVYANNESAANESAYKLFQENLAVYFPSYRHEQPGYLNDVYRMDLQYKITSNFAGYLPNPIEVTSDLPAIANWLMDVVLDSKFNHGSVIEPKIIEVVSKILFHKLNRPVNIGIGPRNYGGARIQIVDAQTEVMIYPSIFNISAGEAALLCLFGELMKQADRIGKKPEDVEGIVLVDEIDKHLHVTLQMKCVAELMKMFPGIQFIISTHSAFVNIGLSDVYKERCKIIDLDLGGVECEAGRNEVFREAYDTMIKENERYKSFYIELSERVRNNNIPIVYLEGRTDEKYFKKAIEVFDYSNDIVDFQWIGHLISNGNEEFTGASSLDKGIQFVRGRKLSTTHIFLYDCDTKKRESDEGNIVKMIIPQFERDDIKRGIENALELGSIDVNEFRSTHQEIDDYGCINVIQELDKMRMCDYICGLDKAQQRIVLANLKIVIDKIFTRVKGHGQVII